MLLVLLLLTAAGGKKLFERFILLGTSTALLVPLFLCLHCISYIDEVAAVKSGFVFSEI